MKVYQNPTVDMAVWRNYSQAMIKNNKEPLSYERFINHVSRCVAVKHNDSYLFGEMLDRVLFVSHWAPNSAREGIDLIAGLLDLEFQVVLNVLPGKMARMLSRLGLHPQGEVEVDYPYPQTKVVFSNQVRGMVFPEPDRYESKAIEHGFTNY